MSQKYLVEIDFQSWVLVLARKLIEVNLLHALAKDKGRKPLCQRALFRVRCTASALGAPALIVRAL